MHGDICFADATGLARRIREREVSPVEVVKAHLDRISAINPRLNAVVTLAGDALEQAQLAEQAIMRGDIVGPLHGVPFTCKDMFDVAGVRTTRGSKLFEHRIADRDATAVARLKQAGVSQDAGQVARFGLGYLHRDNRLTVVYGGWGGW